MPILKFKQRNFKQSQIQPKMAAKKHFLQGFSLLELLVVIGLLGVVAMAATTLIIDTGEEKRKDATEKNWDAIRKAIVGDSTQNLNGSPYLSGYVADMGRLPNNIKELMSKNFDYDHDGVSGTAPLQLVNQPEWQAISLSTISGASGTQGAIYGGWRGQYLYTAGSQFFRDGWGNKNLFASETLFNEGASGTTLTSSEEIAIEDQLNFGWNISHSPTLTSADYHCGDLHCEELLVQSLGEGNLQSDLPNPNDSLDYSRNFPEINPFAVTKNEWLQNTTISFDIVFNTAVSATGLDLRIFNFEDDGMEDGTGTPANTPKNSVVLRSSNPQTEEYYPSPPSTPVEVPLTFTSGTATALVQVNITDNFPKGRYAAVVMCTSVSGASPTAIVTDDVVFDGDCAAGNTKTAHFFTILPGTSKVTIPWNIP